MLATLIAISNGKCLHIEMKEKLSCCIHTEYLWATCSTCLSRSIDSHYSSPKLSAQQSVDKMNGKTGNTQQCVGDCKIRREKPTCPSEEFS